jgi:hypothetical protein
MPVCLSECKCLDFIFILPAPALKASISPKVQFLLDISAVCLNGSQFAAEHVSDLFACITLRNEFHDPDFRIC